MPFLTTAGNIFQKAKTWYSTQQVIWWNSSSTTAGTNVATTNSNYTWAPTATTTCATGSTFNITAAGTTTATSGTVSIFDSVTVDSNSITIDSGNSIIVQGSPAVIDAEGRLVPEFMGDDAKAKAIRRLDEHNIKLREELDHALHMVKKLMTHRDEGARMDRLVRAYKPKLEEIKETYSDIVEEHEALVDVLC